MKFYKNNNVDVLEGIKNGNHAIIKAFYKKHLPSVTQYIQRNSGNADDAKDVFQDALVIVYEKIQKNNLNINCALGTYIYGICKYLWLNRLRRLGKTLNDDSGFGKLEDPADDPVELVDKAEKKVIVQKYLLKLGEGCQDILLLFFGGYSLKEIAKQKGFSDGYTRKRKFLCQKKLMALTENDLIFNELQETL